MNKNYVKEMNKMTAIRSFVIRLLPIMLLLGVTVVGCSNDPVADERSNDVADDKIESSFGDPIRLPKGVVVIPGQFVTNVVSDRIENLQDDDLVVAIGNRYMTKLDYERTKSKFEALVRAQSASETEFTNKWSKMSLQAGWDVVSDFLYESAITLEAQRLGIVPNPDDVTYVEEITASVIKRLKLTKEDYAQKYYGDSEALERATRLSALARTYFNKYFRPKLAVDDKEVAELREELERGNELAAKHNEEIAERVRKYADATKIEDLLKLTGEEDRDNELLPKGFHVEILDAMARTALPDDEEIPAILKDTALNTWSKVVELDDTYEIYFITNSIRHNVMTPTFYSGYRIYAEKDLGFTVPDDKRLKADIAMRRNQEVVMSAIGRFRAKYGCVFPHGECWDIPREIKRFPVAEMGKQNLKGAKKNEK